MASEGLQYGQDHDAEDVIEHGRTDHDLSFPGFEKTEFTEHAGGDADARGDRHIAAVDLERRVDG